MVTLTEKLLVNNITCKLQMDSSKIVWDYQLLLTMLWMTLGFFLVMTMTTRALNIT